MAKNPTLSDVTNILTASPTINSNNQKIEEAFQNTLSRDGSTPNQMNADLDLNSNSLLNARNGSFSGRLLVGGVDILEQLGGTDAGVVASIRNTFSGDGTTRVFTLTRSVIGAGDCLVFITAGYQFNSEYEILGDTLTFDVAPPEGTNNIQVVIFNTLDIGTAAASNVSTVFGSDVEAELKKVVQRDFKTHADFAAAVALGFTAPNGSTITVAGSHYIANSLATVTGLPVGWESTQKIWTEAELIAHTGPVAIGDDVILVNVSDEILNYLRTPGAAGPDDITAGDGSDWAKASITSADLLAAVSDAISGLTAIIPVEGSFTPELTFATPGTMSVAYGANQLGYYYKLGSRVYCEVNLNTATITKGTASGRFRLAFSDLPYAPNALSVSTGTVKFKPSQITIPATAIELVPAIVPGQKYIEFAWYSLTSGSSNYLAVADIAETAMVLQVVFEFRA